MKFAPQIAIAAAFVAFLVKGYPRNVALSVGTVSGAIACIQSRPTKKTGLTEVEILELAISSATKQAESELEAFDRLLASKQRDLAELDQLTDEELDRLSQERQQQVVNLNRQIEDLTQLLDEQLAEIDRRELLSMQRLTLEIKQRKQDAETELEVKRQQLEAIAQEDEAWLAAETNRLTQQLEKDKQVFLSRHQAQIEELCDRIDLLESELAATHQLLDRYEEPEMPRGFDVEKVVAYKLQYFWRVKGIITHLINAYPDEANRRVLVRLRPKTGGQKQFKKEWLNELQIQEDLPEPVGICTVGGAIEFEIKPRTWTAFKPWNDSPPSSPSSPLGSEKFITERFENGSPVDQEELLNFQAPMFRFEPKGEIKRLEQVWIVSLWESGVKTQGTLLPTVYRSITGNPVSKGDGASFINARERMYLIFDLQGIEYIRRGA